MGVLDFMYNLIVLLTGITVLRSSMQHKGNSTLLTQLIAIFLVLYSLKNIYLLGI